MPDRVIAYVGLGSNLENPRQQLARAFQALRKLRESRVIARSSLYSSPPMGPPGQPDYLNAVVALQTRLSAPVLLTALQRIESAQGRVRKQHWGPRTLDLDLLLYADQVSAQPALTLPHPGIATRAFVLYPLAEIAPDLIVTGLGPIADLLRRCPLAGLERLPELDVSARGMQAGGHDRTH